MALLLQILGNNRTIVTRDVQRPMALTQYEGQLYWSDWASKTIEKANKTDGAMQTVIQMDVDNVMDIAVYHHSRQSGNVMVLVKHPTTFENMVTKGSFQHFPVQTCI